MNLVHGVVLSCLPMVRNMDDMWSYHSKNATFSIRNYFSGALLLPQASLSERQG